MSFEAVKELETIVEKLERGDVSLDDAVAAYERNRTQTALPETP